MTNIQVLFFDVLGTIVDWRGNIAAEADAFLRRNKAEHIDASRFADDWVGRYDAAVDPIRRGQQPFVPLDTINMANLMASLSDFGLDPSSMPPMELEKLNRAWHRLNPWPDAVAGLSALKQRFIVAPLSDGNTRLLVNMAKHGSLPWDTIFGGDISQAYKPMPDVYLRACDILDVSPEDAMLVAAHDYDLKAARKCRLKTAYIRRESARDPSKIAEYRENGAWDYTADSLTELAEILT